MHPESTGRPGQPRHADAQAPPIDVSSECKTVDSHGCSPSFSGYPLPVTLKNSRAVSPGRTIAIAAIAVGALILGIPAVAIAVMIAEDARGVVTVIDTPQGKQEVYWRDYPGVAGLEPSEVLAGPSLERGEAEGRALLRQIEDALTLEFGLEWAPPPTGNGDDVAFPTENFYGGMSMLSTLNIDGRQSTSVPTTWAEKERVMELVTEVAAEYGYRDLTLDHDADYMSDAELVQAYGATSPEESVTVSGSLQGEAGQWLWFTITDLSLDHDGRFTEQAQESEQYGWQPNTISLFYGANALLPESDRAEFERRLAPFIGLSHPEPLES